jgi:hypothetical protein
MSFSLGRSISVGLPSGAWLGISRARHAAIGEGYETRVNQKYRCFGRERAEPKPPIRASILHAAPDPTPLWNILDWTPGGRGTDWYPKLDYGADA